MFGMPKFLCWVLYFPIFLSFLFTDTVCVFLIFLQHLVCACIRRFQALKSLFALAKMIEGTQYWRLYCWIFWCRFHLTETEQIFFPGYFLSIFCIPVTYWPLFCWMPSMFTSLRNMIMLLAGTKWFCCVLSIAIYSQWDFNSSLSQLAYSNKCIKTSDPYFLLISDWGHWGIQIHEKYN